jgi:four helix bundle protein
MSESPNVIKAKSYKFALDIIVLCNKFRNQNEYVLSRQLMRSGTSIGANVEEAGAAQSRKDFISKMSIASKEARESNYWLRLLRDSNSCKDIDLDPLINDSSEVIKILTSIVKSSQNK